MNDQNHKPLGVGTKCRIVVTPSQLLLCNIQSNYELVVQKWNDNFIGTSASESDNLQIRLAAVLEYLSQKLRKEMCLSDWVWRSHVWLLEG